MFNNLHPNFVNVLALIILGAFMFTYWLPTVAKGRVNAFLRKYVLNHIILTGERGGFVHDAVSFFIPPSGLHYVTGTWADAAGAVANTVAKTCSLGDNTAVVSVPCTPIQNGVALKGFYLTSIDVWFELLTAAPTTLDALIHSITLPADEAVQVVSSLAFSYDTGHDTAGERDDVDQHKMTCTLTTPVWIDEDVAVYEQITIDGAASTVVHFLGARINGTLKI